VGITNTKNTIRDNPNTEISKEWIRIPLSLKRCIQMNERIKKIAEQAWEIVSVQDALNDEAFEKFDQTFAELIIQECCDIFVELRTRPAKLAVKDLKIHFGMKL
jgi:hypothetical protein